MEKRKQIKYMNHLSSRIQNFVCKNFYTSSARGDEIIKNIIVTGASRGIGAAICQRLIEQGVHVVGVSRSANNLTALEKAIASPLFSTVSGDVGDLEVIRKTIAKSKNFGDIDAVILNAGHVPDACLIESYKNADLNAIWGEAMRVNSLAPALWASNVLPHLSKNKGRIIYIASAIGTTMAFPGTAAYSASKAAGITCMRVLASESKLSKEERLVCTLSVSPGVVDTDAFDHFSRGIKEVASNSPQAAALLSLKQKGAIRKPLDVAGSIVKLALNAPKDKSGQYVEWDADWVLKL